MALALNYIVFELDICVLQSEALEYYYFLLHIRYALNKSPSNALALIVLDYWRVAGTDKPPTCRWRVYCIH